MSERGSFRAAAGVCSWRQGETTVLFDSRRAVMCTLEGVGERIWMTLREGDGASLAALVEQLDRERRIFGGRVERMVADTAGVLSRLLAGGWIEAEPEVAPSAPADASGDDAAAYQPSTGAEQDAADEAAPAAVIVVLATSAPIARAVAAAIEPFARPELVDRVAGLGEPFGRGAAALVLTTFVDAEGMLVDAAIGEIARRRPWLPMYLYRKERDPDGLDEIAARAVVGLRLVVGPAELVAAVKRTVASSPLLEQLRRAVDPLGILLPRELRGSLDLFARCAAEGRSVGDVAPAMQLTPEQLRRALASAGWPPPKEIVTWLRRISAAILLARPGARVGTVAAALRYGGPRGLSKLFEPLPGFPPREMRGRDRTAEVLARFRELLQSHAGPT